MQQAPPGPPGHFVTSEGIWRLHAERTQGLINFSNDKSTKVTVARLGNNTVLLVFNVKESLVICDYAELASDPARGFEEARSLTFSGIPTCHAFCAMDTGHDFVVGMASGEVVTFNLFQQLSDTGVRAKDAMSYNSEGGDQYSSAKVTSVSWSPLKDGTFVASSADGCIYFFEKGKKGTAEFLPIKETVPPLFSTATSKSSKSNPHVRWHVGCGAINETAFSPDGTKLATVGRDGTLRVFDVRGERLLSGCKSYYGALCCLAWSPDSRLIAAGGEDDLVSIYSLSAGCIVAWGEGHNSFVSAVAFDPWWEPPLAGSPAGVAGEGSTYRLASVAQDACVIVWEIPALEELPRSPTDSTAVIVPSPKRIHVPRLPPVTAHAVHAEPLSGLAFVNDALVTGDMGGVVKTWMRPSGRETRPSVSL